MIKKLKNKEYGLVELGVLDGEHAKQYNARSISQEFIHPDYCYLDEGEEKERRLNVIRSVNCLVPIASNTVDKPIKNTKGEAKQVIVAQTGGDGSYLNFSIVTAVYTSKGIFADPNTL